MNRPPAPTSIDLAREADFALGSAQVRPALRVFALSGVEEQLEPRVMQVLVALARRAGAVISREDLVELCWEGRVVGDDAIQRAVARVRRLGETSGAFEVETIPRVGYRLCGNQIAEALGAPGAEPLLAVLPFDNLTADPDFAFFADGVADEILQTLARATNIKVIGRASSFQLRGAEKAVRKVAVELGATHVLDGSVRRSGDRVRIGAQLIEVQSQTTIWSSQFDRSVPDLLALQDEIAVAVAAALKFKFMAVPAEPIEADAYEAFLRARELFNNSEIGVGDLGSLDQVPRRAPEFAPGWALASAARMAIRQYNTTNDAAAAQLYQEARSAAECAFALNPRDSAAVAALERTEPICGNWTAREVRLRKALGASPGAIEVMSQLGDTLRTTGRFGDALAYSRECAERNPLSAMAQWYYATDLWMLGRAQPSWTLLEDVCRRWPAAFMPWRSLIQTGAQMGRWDVVDRWLTPDRIDKFTATNPRFMRQVQQTVAFYRSPTANAAKRLVERAREHVERTRRMSFVSFWSICNHADLDTGYELVEKASFEHLFELGGRYEFGDFGLTNLFWFPAQAPQDPRFVGLCARLGLARHWVETDRWPDCADLVRYDFRAEARRLADLPPRTSST